MKFGNILITVLLFVMVVSVILLIQNIREEKTKCLKEPIIYGIKNIESTYNNTVSCQCSLIGKSTISVLATNKGFQLLEMNNPYSNNGINFSKLNLD